MSILNDSISKRAQSIIKIQQQPDFPLRYDFRYGPYTPITSVEESYKKNFINLLLTSPGEWPMNPEIGIGLKHYLFENPDSEKLQSLEPTIRNQLRKFLPQISLANLDFDYNDKDLQENRLRIVLSYIILGSTGHSTSFGFSGIQSIIDVVDLGAISLQPTSILNRAAGIVSNVEML
tara:strand:+ start:3410 stop:3940 length:531 start_codon:yes stop_codon:yes gene_type:complete